MKKSKKKDKRSTMKVNTLCTCLCFLIISSITTLPAFSSSLSVPPPKLGEADELLMQNHNHHHKNASIKIGYKLGEGVKNKGGSYVPSRLNIYQKGKAVQGSANNIGQRPATKSAAAAAATSLISATFLTHAVVGYGFLLFFLY